MKRALLSVVVGKAGTPDNIRAFRGAAFGLDEMAIEAVKAWRFEPGMKAVKLNFTLRRARCGRTHQR